MNGIYKGKLFLAPMAGVTDETFRKICTSLGADVSVSEMICAKALVYEQRSHASVRPATAPLAHIPDGTKNCILQLFGHEEDIMAEAARRLASGEYRGFSGELPIALDINMGCPVKKIVSNGEGSALMKDPALAERLVSSVKKATNLPVSVKMRIGWDKDSINASEFAKALECGGADAIFVHGRTREQMYSGHADYSQIARVKAAVSVPVIGNGDVFTVEDAKRMYEETGCDSIMIGRGSLGNPWLFGNVKRYISGTDPITPTSDEVREMMIHHLNESVRIKGERRGLAETKSHMAWYIKSCRGAASIRDSIMRAETRDEIECAINAAFPIE
jgi:nifR3 family TIM-barrel protein